MLSIIAVPEITEMHDGQRLTQTKARQRVLRWATPYPT
jgi:hypothetical protein